MIVKRVGRFGFINNFDDPSGDPPQDSFKQSSDTGKEDPMTKSLDQLASAFELTGSVDPFQPTEIEPASSQEVDELGTLFAEVFEAELV